MSKVDQKIREMDFYFEDVQKTNEEIQQLIKKGEDNGKNIKLIKKK